ncbi:hypothetical protein EPUS_06596 [Endocarpon pusillum Z07020]|uniref:Nuclear segregation protein Bfr1 n=1 Tax=Endocarpon pusillum (strain Z07020 / HMAS-L-300199) TaxID=1263415 RepID=U1GQ08_ENDPU|nr:uncharacterized protein EPUS_06596 [Endocarpon pusillum Z07020]ERF74418.1 hypothetical protein EPUS_06596 [Endocarpon pusillum Z07020]
MGDSAKASLAGNGSTQRTRPEKPDQARYEADLAAAQKEHNANMEKFNAARSRFDGARAGKGSPANDKWNALVAEQKKISEQQREIKKSRSAQRDKYNAAEAQLKSMIADQKDAKGRMGFKSVGEIDAKISDLTKQVDSGTMRLVDEKKALNEVSSLTRQRKGFSGIEEAEKRITAKKAENAELKKAFDDPEARALDEKYEAIRKELDEISAARDDDRKNFTSLKEERDRLHQEQQMSYQKIKDIKDAYFQGRKAHKAYEDELYQQRRERQKAERDAYEKERRKKVAEEKLEQASQPAYLDEIITTEGLIRYFDPSSAVSDSKKGPGKFAASAQRSVDDSAMKGMKVVKKDEEDFFVGGGGKKKGKGKKAAPEATKFNMSIGIIEELGKVGVEPPSNQSDVPAVVEKLKEKLESWKKDQETQTKQNIEKAQKEIDRLEREADEAAASTSSEPKAGGRRRDASKKVSAANHVVDGEVSAEAELDQEKDAAADVTTEMQKAEIEDKKNDAAVEAQS